MVSLRKCELPKDKPDTTSGTGVHISRVLKQQFGDLDMTTRRALVKWSIASIVSNIHIAKVGFLETVFDYVLQSGETF